MWPVTQVKTQTKDKLSCVKLAICPDHPRWHSRLIFCMRSYVQNTVIYFKFHENRSRGLVAVEVENRPLPLTWLMAYTTACTTVQAVQQDGIIGTRQWDVWIVLSNDCSDLKSTTLTGRPFRTFITLILKKKVLLCSYWRVCTIYRDDHLVVVTQN